MRVTSILRSANSLAASAARRELNEPVRIEPAKTRIFGLRIGALLPFGPRAPHAPLPRFGVIPGRRLRAGPESILPAVVMDSGLFAEPVIGPSEGRTRWLRPRNDGYARLRHHPRPDGRPRPSRAQS